jgi:hypothetical protein
MNKRLYKTYVVRILDGTPKGRLTQSSLTRMDSTLLSPGAADDTVPVGVMIESMRVFVGTPGWEPKHAIMFSCHCGEEAHMHSMC